MKSRTGLVRRRVLPVLAIIAAAWLIAFASGVGLLAGREEVHIIKAEGSRITCRYIHATGTYEIVHFTENPDAFVCARFASVRSPHVSGDHWAAPLPSDKSVQIECRFFRRPADGDDGLGTRFTAEAPLRLRVNFAAKQFTLTADDDRSALGEPVLNPTLTADNGAIAWIVFSHGAIPILAGNPPGHLELSITSRDGHAVLMLTPAAGQVLWSRDGGCRLGA